MSAAKDFARLLRGSDGRQVIARVDHNDDGEQVVKWTVHIDDVFIDYAIGPFPDGKAFQVLEALQEPKAADAVLKEIYAILPDEMRDEKP